MRFLARDSAVYGMAGAISRFASLLTFPIVVRHLSVSDYGVLDILQILGSFLTVFLIFGQDSGVARYFFEYEDREVRRELISQSFFMRIYVLLVALPVIWVLGRYAIAFLDIDDSFQPAFNVLLLQVPFIVLLNFAVVLLRVTFSRNPFIFLSIGFSFTQAACWLVAIFYFEASVRGILLAGLGAVAVFAGIGIFFVRQWIRPTFRLNHIVEMLPYSLPYGAISALRGVVPLAERSLVALLLATDALGLYAAGAKITMLYGLFAFAFQSAWEPFALSIAKQADAQATYNLVLKIFVLLACLLALALMGVARPLIMVLAGEKYLDATVIVFPLLMALVIESIGWITEIGLIVKRRTSLKLVGYVLGSAASILGIVVLAPGFGIGGVALAALLGSVVKTTTVTLLARRVHDMEWHLPTLFIILPITLIGGLLTSAAASKYGFVAGLATSVGFMAVLLGVAYAVVLTGADRDKLSQAIRRVLSLRAVG